MKELFDAISATKESLTAKKKNPNHFEIKKKDNCQRVIIPNNEGNPSIKCNKEALIF